MATVCGGRVGMQLRTAARGYFELCVRLPWSTAFAVCFVKSSLSDVFAQRLVEGRGSLDTKRTLVFASFGGWYCGWFQHCIYNLLYNRLYGKGTGLGTVAKKLLTDHFVHVPLVCLPCAFLWQEALLPPLKTGGHFPRCDDSLLPDTARRWTREVFDIMCAYWTIWTPGHIVTFVFMPEALRITWIAAVSGVYLVIFSYLSHRRFLLDEPKRG